MDTFSKELPDIYRTYGWGKFPDVGSITFDLNSFENNKPARAWWGVPMFSEYTYEDYCRENGLETEIFDDLDNCCLWYLEDDSKILRIDSFEDVQELAKQNLLYPHIYNGEMIGYVMDFTSLYFVHGYSAILLSDSLVAKGGETDLENAFKSWGGQSILVLDSSKIVVIDEDYYIDGIMDEYYAPEDEGPHEENDSDNEENEENRPEDFRDSEEAIMSVSIKY